MDKKGFLLAEEMLKIILAVIAIGFLAYLLFSLYQANKDTRDLEFAEASLDHLFQEINAEASEVEIYNPKKWYINIWSLGSEPRSCSNLEWNKCICICKRDNAEKCNDAGACLENVWEFSMSGSVRIIDPPIILNIDHENKIIS